MDRPLPRSRWQPSRAVRRARLLGLLHIAKYFLIMYPKQGGTSLLVRIFAIGAIFAGTTVAWMILAGSISSRTNDSNEKLKTDVSSTWGTPQVQIQPSAIYTEERQIRQESQVDGKKVVSTQTA